ncbi:UNKNOWN [Stylonychia lemnae]|uniref:Uncharacterized protein n=1 Tax=Stylonychia lemnae TaxID=5949 RepID=A0A078AG38_STYLE|nr:UNKNOWN [Stylonychia lemnae]|eukprot:CDW80422.1 UNKNOWN [Stylonychia lemnae]
MNKLESKLKSFLVIFELVICKLSVETYIEKRFGFELDQRQYINLIQQVDASIDGNQNFKARQIVFTNKGIHMMRYTNNKACSVFPPENLCPEDPKTKYKFKHDKILEVVIFLEVVQKLFIIFQLSEEMINLKDVIQDQQATIKDDQTLLGTIHVNLGLGANPSRSLLSSFWGEEQIIQSSLLLALSKTHVVLLNEYWSKWFCIDDFEKIQALLEKMQQKLKDADEGQSMAQKAEENKIKVAVTGTLQLVLKKTLSEIMDLHVHKGKDSVVELQFGNNKIEKLIFPCDYSRQQFIESLLDVKLGRSNGDQDNM